MKALAQLARLGGMSQVDFDACTQNEELFAGIRERALDGQIEFDIQSTPSFVVNGRVIRGGMSYTDFKNILEDAVE
jgi:protein-disulfide isomerase